MVLFVSFVSVNPT